MNLLGKVIFRENAMFTATSLGVYQLTLQLFETGGFPYLLLLGDVYY